MYKFRFLDALYLALAFGIVAIGAYFIFSIGDIIVMFLAAFLFAIALDKPLDKLVKIGIKRIYAVAIIYTAFFALVVFLIYVLVPPLAQELRELTNNIPSYIQETTTDSAESALSPASVGLIKYISTLSNSLVQGSQTIAGIIFKVSDGFMTFLIVFFVSLFLNLSKYGMKHFFTSFTPQKHRDYAGNLFTRVEDRVGAWLWGKSISSVFVGSFVFVGLFIIGIEYALTFAIFAAFLNFIPFIGPFIAAIFPIFLGLIISPAHAFAVAALYFAANSIENFILIPALMKHSINLNPALLIFAVLVGGKIGGVLGVIIAVPVAAILTLVYEEYTMMSLEKEKQPIID